MVVHETIGVADPIVALIDVLKGIEEVFAVPVVPEYGFLLVATGGNVINGSGIFYAEGTGHGLRIDRKMENVKPQDLTLRGPICLTL